MIWISFVNQCLPPRALACSAIRAIMAPTSFWVKHVYVESAVLAADSLLLGFPQKSSDGVCDDGSFLSPPASAVFSNNNLILWPLPKYKARQMEADWQMY